MPGNQGRSSLQTDITVRGYEYPARKGRLRLQNKECKREYEDSKPFSHRSYLLLFRVFTYDDDTLYGKVPFFPCFMPKRERLDQTIDTSFRLDSSNHKMGHPFIKHKLRRSFSLS